MCLALFCNMHCIVEITVAIQEQGDLTRVPQTNLFHDNPANLVYYIISSYISNGHIGYHLTIVATYLILIVAAVSHLLRCMGTVRYLKHFFYMNLA